MATPLFAALKAEYPGANLTLWTDSDLSDLFISLCPAVDEVIDYDFEAKTKQLIDRVKKQRPDLFVDLTVSDQGKVLGKASGAKVLTYNPEDKDIHQVDDFLVVLQTFGIKSKEPFFPSLFPEFLVQKIKPKLELDLGFGKRPLIGLSPGVSSAYPSRAWSFEGWEYLIEFLLSNVSSHQPVLFGMMEDRELCSSLAARFPKQILNCAGSLSVTELAAALFCTDLLISCDSPIGHLAVAVGLPVIGLYGASSGKRRGPYGQADLLIDASEFCECNGRPQCKISEPNNSGRCMNRLAFSDICHKVKLAFPES